MQHKNYTTRTIRYCAQDLLQPTNQFQQTLKQCNYLATVLLLNKITDLQYNTSFKFLTYYYNVLLRPLISSNNSNYEARKDSLKDTSTTTTNASHPPKLQSLLLPELATRLHHVTVGSKFLIIVLPCTN